MRHDPTLRLPILTEAGDFEKLSELSQEERQIGATLVESHFLGQIDYDGPASQAALKEREPLFISAYDPQMAASLLGPDLYGAVVQSVCDMTLPEIYEAATRSEGFVSGDPEKVRSWQLAMLFVFKVAHELRDEWTLRLMATKPNLFDVEKAAVLGFPESNVWNEQERLVLEFTDGVLHHSVSDELFERATTAWGTKGMLRRATWIGLYHIYVTLGHLNLNDAYKRGRK